MTSEPMRYFIYARKSTDDKSRQVRSIDDQIAEARELAAREKLRVLDVLIERRSAKAPGRPVFEAMLERIRRGEAHGIIAWHPDRLSRNALDAGQIVHMIDLGHITDLRFPTFRFEPTAQGKFMLNIILSQSKYYVDNLSENIKRGKRHMVAAGLWPQAAPMGYVNDKATRTITPHAVYGKLMTEMFERYATGKYTLRHLRDVMVEKGLRSSRDRVPTVSKVQLALRNPIYYGVLRFKAEFYDGKHTPVISKALFDKCQSLMKGRRHFKTRGYKPFLYRGVFRCGECGGMITMEMQKGHKYLRCTKKHGKCGQKYVREEVVTDEVRRSVGQIAITERFAKELIRDLDTISREHESQHKDHLAKLQARLAQCNQQLSRLLDGYADQAVSVDEYCEAKNRRLQERREIQETIDKLLSGREDRLEPMREAVRVCASATSALEEGDDEEILKIYELIGSNRTLRDRRLACVLHEAWQVFVDEQDAELGGSGSGIARASGSAREREERIKRRGGDSNPR